MNSLNASTPGNLSALAEKCAGCYRSPAWTPSRWLSETKCSTATLSCLSDWHGQQPCESPLQPQPPSPRSRLCIREQKNPISLLAAAVPTLPAVPPAEVTPVAVQAQVLLTPSVACGLIPGKNCRDRQIQKAAKPCH